MSAGVLQWVGPDRLLAIRRRFDESYAAAIANREHLWVATVSYFVSPPLRDGATLDVENLASDPAVGCYVCEELWGRDVAKRPCGGEPR